MKMNESTFKVNSSFVSERINKIKFIDDEELFVSGSESNVKLWKLISNQFNDEIENEYTPKAMSKLAVDGDVTGLEIVDHNNFVVSSGTGVSCVYINRDMERNNMKENFRFKNLHKFSAGDPALCTGLSIHEDCISTIGEDGRVVVLSMSNQKVMLELENVDSVTQTTVKFINFKELITGNRLGIMKCIDLRSGSKEPTATLVISCEDEKKSNAVTCIANHPTQQHIVSSL
jgi:nuclear pore complex protein Nup43